MAVMTVPDFTLKTKNPNPSQITDAEWWLWERCQELEPVQSELGGILANKKGFHGTGKYNSENYPDNYSIRDEPNHTGPWWWNYASALDWTFKDAQSGSYATINRYTQRLINSGKDGNDPRLDGIMYEVFGQADGDGGVEGWNEYRDEAASSDPSHLWHMHISFLRNKCGDFWAMWGLYTVLLGWTVAQWRESLNGGDTMWCKKGDTGDKVLALQLRLVDSGAHVGPPGQIAPADQPYKWCDGEYGSWTSTGLASLVGGNGETYGVWEERALNQVYAAKNGKGEKGDPGAPGKPGEPGAPGKTPTQVTFGPVTATVTAAS